MLHARLNSSVRGAVYLATLLIMVLASCSQEHLPPVATLTVWQAPGITQVASAFGLHSGPGKGVISHVSAYLANTGEPRILFTEDSELFDVRLDGGDLRSLGSGCESDPFAIPATTWVACEDGGAMMLIDHQDPTARQRLTGAEGIYPSWMSDGARVALAEGGCVVALYDVALKEFSLTQYAQLTFTNDGCAIAGIALSLMDHR